MDRRIPLLCAVSILSLGAGFAMLGYARAADLPSHKTAPTPPPVVATPWTGVYVGGFGAFLFGAPNGTLLATGNAAAFNVTTVRDLSVVTWNPQAWGSHTPVSLNDTGGVVGATIGGNYQMGSFVIGAEADGGALLGAQGSQTSVVSSAINGVPSYVQVGRTADWLGTVRARVGFLLTPTLLIYGTGGIAFGHANASVGTYSSAQQAVYTPATTGTVRAGWAGGGGVEWMFAQNWSAKVEYLRADLGTTTIQTGAVAAFGPFTGTQSVLVKAPFSSNVVKVGVNYHLDWTPTPILAKY